MAYRKSNLAYDLSSYEEYAERSMARENIKARRAVKTGQSVVAAPALVLLIIAAGAMLSLCISSKADIAAVHSAIVSEEALVKTLEQENSSMVTRIEQKSSQKAVEDYAENILGMQKLDSAQIEYVTLESGNKVEISEGNSNIFTKIKNSFNSFVEYLMG